MRAWALAGSLAVSGACVVVGVALLSFAAAWIVGGLLLGGLSYLLLAEVPS